MNITCTCSKANEPKPKMHAHVDIHIKICSHRYGGISLQVYYVLNQGTWANVMLLAR